MVTAAQQPASPDSPLRLARRPSILIVDDDLAICESLVEMLEDEGFHTATAMNGRVALDQLRAGLRPCVILLDLMMPVMDGWDFRSEQLRDPTIKDIPVVVVTAAGFSRETVMAQFNEAEMIPKPPTPELLVAAIRRSCMNAVAPS